MIEEAAATLKANQVNHLQRSMENLHNIQELDELTDAIVNEGTKLVGGGKGMLFVFDQSIKQLIMHSCVNVEKREKKRLEKITRKLFEQNKYRSRLSIKKQNIYFFPIKRQRDFSGVLLLIPTNQQLSKGNIKLINIFMQSVPVFMENSRLYLMMQRKTESFSYMNQLHKLITVYSFQDILEEIVRKIGEFIESEMAGIMLYDPNTNELRLQKPAFGVWQDSIIEQYRVSLTEESNAKNVFLTGIPSITIGARYDERYNKHFVELFNANSIVTVPLIVENKRIGVLHAINKKQGYFTDDDLKLLTEISNELGIIIQAALQMSSKGVSEYKRSEIDRYLVNQLFEHVLDGDHAKLDEAKNIMETLRIPVEDRLSVIQVGVYAKGEWHKEILKNNLFNILAKIEKILKTPCAIYKDGTIVILAPHKTEEELNHLCKVLQKELQRKIKEEIQEATVYIGIGESVDSIKYSFSSYQQSGQILYVLPQIEHMGSVGYYPACGIWTLLSSVIVHNREVVSAFLRLYLNKLNRVKNAKQLKETLDAYIKHNGQIKKTAEDLFVHHNTLKYRLEKIEQITGYDLSDAETRLNLNIALRLEKMITTPSQH